MRFLGPMSNLYGEAEFRERRAYNPQSVISRHSDEYSRNDRTWQYSLAGESGGVGKRLDTRKEEVCAAFKGEGEQALYHLADRTLRKGKVERALLRADHRIVFTAQLMKIRIVRLSVLQARIGG